MDIRDVQSRLAAAHLYEGSIDGGIGNLTRAGIRAFLMPQSVDGFEM